MTGSSVWRPTQPIWTAQLQIEISVKARASTWLCTILHHLTWSQSRLQSHRTLTSLLAFMSMERDFSKHLLRRAALMTILRMASRSKTATLRSKSTLMPMMYCLFKWITLKAKVKSQQLSSTRTPLFMWTLPSKEMDLRSHTQAWTRKKRQSSSMSLISSRVQPSNLSFQCDTMSHTPTLSHSLKIRCSTLVPTSSILWKDNFTHFHTVK